MVSAHIDAADRIQVIDSANFAREVAMRRLFFTVIGLAAVCGHRNFFSTSESGCPARARPMNQPTRRSPSRVAQSPVASTATGNIEPESEVALAFRAAGVVEAVHIVAGQPVASETLLATLETTELTLDPSV